MFTEIPLSARPLVAAATVIPQTCGIFTGSGGTMVVVMWNDQAKPGSAELQTTLVGTIPGCYLPISIAKYISGPTDAIGFAM